MYSVIFAAPRLERPIAATADRSSESQAPETLAGSFDRPFGAHRDRDPGCPDIQIVCSDRDRLGLDLGSQCSGNRTEPDFAECPLAARRRGQQRREHRVHRQDHTHLGHEAHEPVTLPSSRPQNNFNRALIRSTAVRPLYIRSNFLVARGSAGNRLRSTSRGTRTVLPYDLPALQTVDIGHSQSSCLAGQRYLIVSRAGSYPM